MDNDYGTQPPPSTGTTTTTTTVPAQPREEALATTGSQLVGFVLLLAVVLVLAGLGLRALARSMKR